MNIEIDLDVVDGMLALNGEIVQQQICIEELSELIKEISKQTLRQASSPEALTDEIADVLFTIEYVKKANGITDEDIQERVTYKTLRTKARYLNDR